MGAVSENAAKSFRRQQWRGDSVFVASRVFSAWRISPIALRPRFLDMNANTGPYSHQASAALCGSQARRRARELQRQCGMAF
jgi:hypothetical protein